MQTISVLGDGAWGTAVAQCIGTNGHYVTLWCNNQEAASAIIKDQKNTIYLPDIQLSSNITTTTDIKIALQADIIFEAVPVKYLRSVLEKAAPYVTLEQLWIVLSKGIEQNTFLLPSHIIEQVLTVKNIVSMSGPSYAREFAMQQPTAFTLASNVQADVIKIQNIITADYVHTACSTDLIGVQVIGALKNILALAIGIVEGAGYYDNAKARMLTQGIHEICTFITLFGGQKETIFEYAGIGDIVLTAYGKESRNRALGIALGQGKNLEQLLQSTSVPESINTLRSVHQLMQERGITAPLFSTLYTIVFDGLPIDQLFNCLRSSN